MKTKVPLSKRKKHKGFIKGIRDHHTMNQNNRNNRDETQ
jgi:hypothetical protein